MRRFLYAISFAITGTLVLNTLASAQQPAQGSTPIIPAATGLQPELGTLQSHTAQELQLEVFINNVSTGLLGAFEQARDGHLSAKAGELKELGLRPPKGKGADDVISLNDLAGVSYRVVSETQMVYIVATDAARLPKIIDANPTEKRQPAAASTGAVLNYSLFSSTDNMLDGSFETFRGVSGGFDGRIFSRFGTLSQSFTASLSDGELGGVERLNTLWTYSDQNRLVTYKVGDFISGGLSWTRPVYLGGMQVSRNFRLRSDLVTLPMPGFTGTAAVPSTLEVYTRNAKTFSMDVPAGPFSVTNLPAYTGNGDAQVVVRDTLGRETRTSLPFYNTADMLKQGLIDFSVDGGFPRRNFGTESNDYFGEPVGSATARYGATDMLTLQSHVEGGAGLINGGAGAVFSVGGYGALSLAAAGSHYEDGTGMLLNGGLQFDIGSYSLYGNVQQTFGSYDDIASISADDGVDLSSSGYIFTGYTQIYSPRVPRRTIQASLSVPTPIERASLNLSFTHIEADTGEKSSIAGISYSQAMFKSTSFYASAFTDLNDSDSFGIFAGLSIPFDNGIGLNTGLEQSPDGLAVTTALTKHETQREGSYGWSLRDRESDAANRSASASYRSKYARIEGQVNQYDDTAQGNLWVDGAIAVAGGGVFATNRLDDAFAVVKVGAPDVEVRSDNRVIGRTNKSGRIIVPNLNSYEENRIDIDTTNLPVDATIDSTRTIVVPAQQSGVVVDFGVKEDPEAAVVSFVDAAGQPLQAGLAGSLNGQDDAFVVGYDGQAFIQGLKANNAASIHLADGATCTAEFEYQPTPGQQVRIGGVRCQ
ncbi:fimbria/pilus outer membrane usher protein [Phyllobacterium sp. SYP-B3895]|uniref:fimbria/pilus outer membrane usher protein n=1 Tax=Phyllobacterium sp. SYP-B3895 TaxID=2663240 RepID=UPI001299768B|nr:fimbria/pilus outer membrane usher protein [Phyllobacterium sp. SYP-B3895]MRG57274.1 fimbria/pilus outer membrane usher protein [Phyllobacterium sp. SYP-B3895]